MFLIKQLVTIVFILGPPKHLKNDWIFRRRAHVLCSLWGVSGLENHGILIEDVETNWEHC